VGTNISDGYIGSVFRGEVTSPYQLHWIWTQYVSPICRYVPKRQDFVLTLKGKTRLPVGLRSEVLTAVLRLLVHEIAVLQTGILSTKLNGIITHGLGIKIISI
jgi:hypothetical protein